MEFNPNDDDAFELQNEEINDLSDDEPEKEEEIYSEDGSDDEEETSTNQQENDVKYGKDKSIWYCKPQNIQNCLPEFIQDSSEKVHPMLPIHSIKSAFEYFVTDEMFGKIVDATNQRGKKEYGDKWVDTDVVELRAWVGLHLRAGVDKDSFRPIPELFSSKTGPPIYGATMPRDRFKVLKDTIRFDDSTTREDRKQNDKEGKLAPIKEVFDLFVDNCKRNFQPGRKVTIDETIVAFNGRCNFKVYMPSKPDRHGIKIWSLADSETSYLVDAQIYQGKLSDKKETGQAERVVKDLIACIENTGRSITMDNFFTSVKLAKDLLEKGLSVLGTIRKNKKELPPSFQASRKRNVYSSEFGFSGDARVMLCSYVPKKNKSVIMISTSNYEKRVEEALPNKPNVITEYNKSKSGVDTLDQLVKTYSCKRVSNRWPLVIFYYIIDVSAYNASVCFMHENPELYTGSQKRRKFLMDLSESLVMPLIRRRASSLDYHKLHKETRSRIEAFVPNPIAPIQTQVKNPKKRCAKCPRDKDKKTCRICSRCSIPICEAHSKFICDDCA